MKQNNYLLQCLALMALFATSCKKPVADAEQETTGTYKMNKMMSVGTSAPSGYVLAYEENFNGSTVDPNVWYYRETGKYTGGFNKRENVSLVSQDSIGYLNIAYRDDVDWDNDGNNDISGGGVISKKTFGYGYYQARIKFYKGANGLHESFWTHGMGITTGETTGTEYKEAAKNDLVPTDNKLIEIDGIELDSYMNHGKTNFWLNRAACDCPAESTSAAFNRFSETYMDLDQWIDVGFEWLPNTVIYYINGVERFRYNYQTIAYSPMEVWLSALANTKWSTGGDPEPGASMKVDYFRYYNKPILTNIIGNNSFEVGGVSSEQVVSWVVYDGIYNNSTTDGVRVVFDSTAYHGKAYLQQDAKTGTNGTTSKHLLSYIPNGTYRLTAWVKKTSGMTSAKMEATNIGGTNRSVDIPSTSEWTKVTLDNVVVSSNQAVIGFSTTGPTGQSLKIDKVEMYDKRFPLPNESGVLINDMETGYSEVGTWSNSSLLGYQHSSSRYAGISGQYAQWKPNIPGDGNYEVYLYKIVNANSDPQAKVNITHSGVVTTKYIDFTTGTSGWVFLGSYNFMAGTTGYVRTYYNTAGTYARADAVYFALPGTGAPL